MEMSQETIDNQWAHLEQECRDSAQSLCDDFYSETKFGLFMIDCLSDNPEFWEELGIKDDIQRDQIIFSESFWQYIIHNKIKGVEEHVEYHSLWYSVKNMGLDYDDLF